MTEITLIPKGKIGIMVEAEVIRPDIFAGKSKAEIEKLPVWQGPAQLLLGEFFDVDIHGKVQGSDQGIGSPEETAIIIDGDVSRIKRIGQDMKAGSIEIHGEAGMHLGADMSGGSILVLGSAGSWAGMEMKGGKLHIMGDAGDHAGSAYRGSWRGMTGGKILIEGNARSQLGGGLVGGEIIVEGNIEDFCAIRQSGGSILVKGSAMRGVGAEMNGGVVAVCGKIRQLSPGFVEVGREENPTLGEQQPEGRFDRFTGDYAVSKNPKGSLYLREV